MYITLPELAERPGPRELAQVASTLAQPVRDEALMDATLRGLDRSAWSAEEQAHADAARARIEDAVAEAEAVIDGFLATRGYPLPLVLPPSSAGKNVLAAWTRAISRYLLNKSRVTDEATDPVARDYRDALKMLRLLAQGQYMLSGADPEAKANNGGTDVRFAAASTASARHGAVFGRDQLRAFR